MKIVQEETYGNIKVFSEIALDGGGSRCAEAYVNEVKRKFGPVDTCLEAFSGPGFIGFALLARGLCEKLILADINPKAIGYCRKTIAENSLSDRVQAYCADLFDSLPPVNADLIVGNPPHCWTASEAVYERDIRTFDPHMRIHKKFYADAKKFLKPDGHILLWEDYRATKPEDFFELMENGGLKYVDFSPVVIKEKFAWGRFARLERSRVISKNYFIHSRPA